jgi:hypothetical protein
MTQPPPQVIPAPRGPNSRLLLHSLVLLCAAVALLGHLAGVHITVSVAWPTVLIEGGIVLVVIGQLGLIRRRQKQRAVSSTLTDRSAQRSLRSARRARRR